MGAFSSDQYNVVHVANTNFVILIYLSKHDECKHPFSNHLTPHHQLMQG